MLQSSVTPPPLFQFWMSAVATTMPVPCGAFMPVFLIGEQSSLCVLKPGFLLQHPDNPPHKIYRVCDCQVQPLAD